MALKDKPVLGALVAVGILAISAVLIMRSVSGSAIESYYFDLQTGELFTAAQDLKTPINAPSGASNGVRAYVFACGTCSDANMKVVYIEQLSEEAAQMQANYRPSDDPAKEAEYQRVMEKGYRIAEPPAAGAEPNWQAYFSPQGQALANSHQSMCSGSKAEACMP